MKIIVFLISLIGSLGAYVARNSVLLNLCLSTEKDCRITYDVVENILYFLPLVLLFSIITYWLPTQVFKSWLTWLLISGPLVLLITSFIHVGFLLPNTDMYAQGFGLVVIFVFYGVFFLGSVISIVRGYKANRLLK